MYGTARSFFEYFDVSDSSELVGKWRGCGGVTTRHCATSSRLGRSCVIRRAGLRFQHVENQIGLDKSAEVWYNTCVSDLNGHGGKREGAGRPKSQVPQHVLQSNKVVERKMKSLAEQGWEVLAESYPELIRRGVDVALGTDERAPNVAMLKTLLELMVKVVGVEPDQEDSAIKQLVNKFVDRVQEARAADGRPLEVGAGGPVQHPDRGDFPWPRADS